MEMLCIARKTRLLPCLKAGVSAAQKNDDREMPDYRTKAIRLDRLRRLCARLKSLYDSGQAPENISARWNRAHDAICAIEDEMQWIKPSKRLIAPVNEMDSVRQEHYDPADVGPTVSRWLAGGKSSWVAPRISCIRHDYNTAYVYWSEDRKTPLGYANTSSEEFLGIAGGIVNSVAVNRDARKNRIATLLYQLVLDKYGALWADTQWTPGGLALWTAFGHSFVDIYMTNRRDKELVKVDLGEMGYNEIFASDTAFLMVRKGVVPKDLSV